MGAALQAYAMMEVLPASSAEVVVLAYRRLVAALRRAAALEEAGDLEGRAAHLLRALDLVGELYAALDLERGGEVARRLASLYGFFSSELLDLAQRSNAGRLQRLAGMVSSLLEAWEHAALVAGRESGQPVATG
jgi:flagellar protein FliS